MEEFHKTDSKCSRKIEVEDVYLGAKNLFETQTRFFMTYIFHELVEALGDAWGDCLLGRHFLYEAWT